MRLLDLVDLAECHYVAGDRARIARLIPYLVAMRIGPEDL